MRKKYLIAGVVLALSLSMVGCGKDTGSTTADGTTGDVTTEAEVASEEQGVSLLPMESTDETAFTLIVGDYSLGVKKIEGMNTSEISNSWRQVDSQLEIKYANAYMYNGDTLEESTIAYEYQLSDEASMDGTEPMTNDDGTDISFYASYDAPPSPDAETIYPTSLNYVKELSVGKYLTVKVYVRDMDSPLFEEALTLTDDSYYSEGEVGETSTDTIGHSETEGQYAYIGDTQIIAKKLNNSTWDAEGQYYQYNDYEIHYDIVNLTKDEFTGGSDIVVSSFGIENQTITNGDGDEIPCRKIKTEYDQYVEFYKQWEDENVTILIRVRKADRSEVNPEDFIDLTKDCYFDFYHSESSISDIFN